jgi:hypothetical protein
VPTTGSVSQKEANTVDAIVDLLAENDIEFSYRYNIEATRYEMTLFPNNRFRARFFLKSGRDDHYYDSCLSNMRELVANGFNKDTD